MNTRRMRWMAAALLLVLGAGVPLSADKVKLKSGKVVEGQYMGGDSKAVRVLLASGQVSEIPLTEAVGVEFSPRKPRPRPRPRPQRRRGPEAGGAEDGHGARGHRCERAAHRGRSTSIPPGRA